MQDMNNATENRLAEINREFSKGFEFLANYPKSVTFFGAHQADPGTENYEDARALAGRVVRELDYAVVTGGSSGIMEAANRGAYEAGGKSLGLHIELPTEQIFNDYVTGGIDFHYFFARKFGLAYAAEAYVFYPGGYGTLDEFFELLTLVQTKKIDDVPIICVGSEYWNKVKELLEKEVLARNNIRPQDLNIFTITDSHDEVIEIIKKSPVRTTLPFDR